MGAPSLNLFVGLVNLTLDQWKMIDTDQWDNGSLTVSEPRNYGSASGSGSTLAINGTAFSSPGTAGRYRVTWDGRNPDNVKYEMSPANEMRVVGNGIQGVPDWNPGASPQMTYNGNGVWTITLNLVGSREIKFLAGNDWPGNLDYEDNGAAAAAGTRKIKWEGGNNFSTPAVSGTYTITLNEHLQTVKIQ
jgi:hypothetical protein